MLCSTGYVLYMHDCALACPDFTMRAVSTDPLTSVMTTHDYCYPCHFSCKTCSTPSRDGCLTCCQACSLGALYYRVPDSGRCECDFTTQVETNGLCLQSCSKDMRGRGSKMCYPECPSYTHPFIAWNGTSAQEFSHYDASSAADCQDFYRMLKFTKTGNGLAVPAPSDMQWVPPEFTLQMWVFPTDFESVSYLVNAFGRIRVEAAQSSAQVTFNYVKDAAGNMATPTVTTPTSLVLNSWNFISVSQREIDVSNTLKWEQLLAIAPGRSATVVQVATSNSVLVTNYDYYLGFMYLGALDDYTPKSFSGYLKEVKFFKVYHSYPQVVAEKLRVLRSYSHDDPNLVAYWKLSEAYTSSSNIFTIEDYSINRKSLTVNTYSTPSAPRFVEDVSNKLNLCVFHDVKNC